MENGKAKEFKTYLQAIIDDNDPDVLGQRAVLDNISPETRAVIIKAFKLTEGEEIIAFFDDTFKNSGKGGLLFTSWGVRYKDNAASTNWALAWDELSEKYTVHKEGMVFKKLKLRKGSGVLFTAEKEISLSYGPNIEWLERILSNGCRIITGT
jgi:hypothetical protein